MIKKGILYILLVVLLTTSALAFSWGHSPSEVHPGVFMDGIYSFPGKVGIGVDPITHGLFDLQVRGPTGFGGNVIITGNVGIGTSSVSEGLKLQVVGNTEFVGDVTANGYYYRSDKTLKSDISKLNGSLNKIKQLSGVSFNWKEDNYGSIGLVAQDVEKVFPELVKMDSEGFKSVQYGNLVAPLIEAVKEQDQKINLLIQLVVEQNKKISELQSEINKLK